MVCFLRVHDHKYTVTTGILGIPTALNTLGAVGGSFNILGWGAMNACMFEAILSIYRNTDMMLDTSVIAGRSRNKHPHCHSIVDLTRLFHGNIAAEIISFLFVIGYILCVASAILGISVALNSLSEHAACSTYFTLIGMILAIMFSSIRTWKSMTWPLAISFFCVMAAVLAVIIGAARLKRPAAAPHEGPYDFGFVAVSYPNFAAGISAANAIFASSTGCPGTIPVIAEMKRPQDFTKVTVTVACIVTVLYMCLSMSMYSYTGKWVASPSLGSAGPLVKKIAYGLALPSLVVSAGLFNHVTAKYIFVRVFRKSVHLQSNSVTHWSSWIGLNIGVGVVAFVFAEAVPVFNYLLALLACLCFAPMSIMMPALFWMADNKQYRTGTKKEKWSYCAHVGILLLGIFMCVGGL